MDFKAVLGSMQKNSIKITPYDFHTETPIGSSKIGGMPDLPSAFEWFYFEGESYNRIAKRRPLSFIAQIDCEEAKQFDKDNLLPPKGMLYFFYELSTMTWGFNPSDKGSAKAYYFSGDKSELRRVDFPNDLPKEFQLPEMPVSFSTEISIPDYEELIEWRDDLGHEQYDKYDEARSELIQEAQIYTRHKLLGYADIIQNGMLLECELTTNGIYTGDASSSISDEALLRYKSNCTKWQLLLQIDSIQADDFEILWGDCGKIYYYINTDDLINLNFNDCWLILQCY